MIARTYTISTHDGRIRDTQASPLRVQREQFRWMLNDQFILRFHVKAMSGSTWAYDAQAATDVFTIGIKLSSARQEAAYLASASGIAWNQVADWSEADPTSGKLCCKIDLATTELRAQFQTGTPQVAVIVEIRKLDALGNETTLAQEEAYILQDICKGTEGAPAPASPTHLTAAEVFALFVPRTEDAARWRWQDGCWQAYCADDDSWRPVLVKLINGVPTLVLGDAV